MTGNPIYLVSACATGEEFVAAFRRYADKTGLFVPIGEPFAAGKRARIAVTLVDGGVMIEGEAEVVSSARTPSILHGRVGMTLRFLEPDATSKTLLAELEKARLAMKPAAPSIAPRPATLPAAPRPVPPSPQGRVDAVNALAECVAIGQTAALAAVAAPPTAAVPPRAGNRFVVPTVPTLRPRAPTPAAAVPAITPGLRGDSAKFSAQVAAGPSSDTLVAVPPPGPSSGLPSTLRGAVVVPPEPRAPTPPPFPAVTAPRHATEMAIAVPRTSTKQTPAAPPPPTPTSAAEAIAESAANRAVNDAIVIATRPKDEISARTQVHAGAPRPPTGSAPVALGSTPAQALPVTPAAPAEDVDVDIDLDADVDLEVAEPTDLVALARPLAPPAEAAEFRPRKTAIGVAVAPTQAGAIAQPAAEADDAPAVDPSDIIADETTGRDRIDQLDGMTPIDLPRQRIAPDVSRITPAVLASQALDDQTPIELPVGVWGIPQMTPTETEAAAPAPVSPQPSSPSLAAAFARITPPPASATAPVLPSGDWTIAIDPAAPDGWTSPLPTVKQRPPTAELAMPTPLLRSEQLPIAEPKVQIDPTLIEPLHPQLLDEPAAMPPAMHAFPSYGSGSLGPVGYPVIATPLPAESFPPPYRSPVQPGDAPVYALDPGYQMMGLANPASPGEVADGSFVVPRHSETMLHTRGRRRRLVIVVVSAALAVAIGIAAVALLAGRSEPDVPPAAPPPRSSAVIPAAPPPSPAGAAAAAESAPPAAAPPTGTCFADVSSIPSGAEIVTTDNTVLGTTPQTVSLPCGAAVDLMIRKARLIPVTRSVTPTAGGVKIRVALTKQTALLKISSSPAGAMVTLSGRQLGITPTTVKVPALETSTLTITKNGYEPQTEKVSPKASGGAVRVQLHRLER